MSNLVLTNAFPRGPACLSGVLAMASFLISMCPQNDGGTTKKKKKKGPSLRRMMWMLSAAGSSWSYSGMEQRKKETNKIETPWYD
jgi:hypothetical protein